MVHHKPVKITINALKLAGVIINVVVQHYSFPNSIISDRKAIFTFKFWSLLCYFFGIKRQLSTTFHPQTDGQIEWLNRRIEVYLCAFINWEQNDWTRLLLMAEFAYNNSKNTSTDYILFELNFGYHPWVFLKTSRAYTLDLLQPKNRL